MPIRKLEPKNVWNNFYALTQIPRPSGHTKQVHDFLIDWARKRGIEAVDEDGNGNVLQHAVPTGVHVLPRTITAFGVDDEATFGQELVGDVDGSAEVTA